MGFRKEVRAFMSRSIAMYDLINVLQKQNQDLHDRLMARDFVELKTYDPNLRDGKPEDEVYDPTEDETAAGQIIE